MILHCDECGKPLGEYLFGKGGIAEKHYVGGLRQVGLPDIVCNECFPLYHPEINTGIMEQVSNRKPKPTTNGGEQENK